MRAPRPQRTQPVRLAFLVGVGLLLVLATALTTAALTLSHSLSPEDFARHVGRGLGREVTAESVALSLRPMPRVRVVGISIDGLGTAAAAEVDVRLRPLLRGNVVLRSVRFEDVRLTLHKRREGGFEPIVRTGGGGEPPDWRAFPRVEAERGEIRVVQGKKVSAVIGVQSLSLSTFGADLSAQLVLSGSVGGADHGWSFRPLRLRGQLVRAGDRFSFEEGRVQASDAVVHWWRGSNVRGRFRYADGRVEVEKLDVKGHGGAWQIRGPIQLRGGTRMVLAVRVVGADLASMLSAARDDTYADLGAIHTRFALVLPWRGGPRFDLASGNGKLEIRGGTLPSRSLTAAALSALGRPPQPITTPVEALVAPVTLRDARLHSEEIALTTKDYVLAGGGSLGLDGSLELEGHLDLVRMPTVPITISGSLPHPDIETHLARLPGNGVGAVAGAVKKTGSAIARSGMDVGRRLRGVLFGNDDDAAPPGADDATPPASANGAR